MFSARLYGSRSHKTKQLLADLRGEESKEEEVVTKSMPNPGRSRRRSEPHISAATILINGVDAGGFKSVANC